jgi:hypothetical protein
MLLHETKTRRIVATFKTRNPKTGDMVQTWILPTENPVEARARGRDGVVCGSCPLKSGNGCYVTIHQAPLTVWKKRDYPPFDLSRFAGRKVRFGAYGDPVYMPLALAKSIASVSSGWTGYTHQWRSPLYQGWRFLLMASCETEADVALAHSMGWRTFRVSRGAPLPSEIRCPSPKVTCAECRLCRGASIKAKSILIGPHGNRAGRIA